MNIIKKFINLLANFSKRKSTKNTLDTSLIYVSKDNGDNPYYYYVVKILETDGKYVKYLSGNKHSKEWSPENEFQTLSCEYFKLFYAPAKNQEIF